MVFSSISFLYYFLPCVLILYFIVPQKFKNFILLISSLFFYFYGEPIYILIMLFNILATYIYGILIDKSKNKKRKKIFLILGIITNLSLLIFFKYIDFAIENINGILNTEIKLLKLALPIGISFYTFQTISYLIDLYKGNVKVQKSLLKLALYISLFPQLIAGPIVRYVDIEKQLEERKTTFAIFSLGVKRFVLGLSKKVLLANNLAQLSQIFLQTDEKSIIFYWIYAISTALYIYLDFSAYSDMAIGLGKIFGFDFLENFNYPYISKSITEFWRRWHISLGTWFRDYVYIPLGGNKVKKIKLYRNILIVWLLTGLWHGASWNFVIWGIYFGIILIIEKKFLLTKLEKIPSFISRIYVLFLVMISFIIFNADNIGQALQKIGGLIGITENTIITDTTIYYLKSYILIILISIIVSTPIIKNAIIKAKENKCIEKIVNILEPLVIGLLLIICTGYLVDNSFNPFLYFRF